MMKLRIPYNKIQMNIEIPDANFQGVHHGGHRTGNCGKSLG